MELNASSGHLLRTEHALAQSEVRRQALLDCALDCIIFADAQGKITEFNPAAERTFHISRSRALGEDLVDTILIAPLRNRIRQELFSPAVPGTVDVIGNRMETRCLRSEGGEFPAEVTVTQILVEKQTSYVVYVRDLTARRIAEETLVRLAAIVESSQDAILSKDLTGRITSWNRGAELMYGYSAREILGRNVSILTPPERSEETWGIIKDLVAGKCLENFETVRKGKTGNLIQVSLTVSPVLDSDGTLIGASTIARDITVQKRAEEALRRANETSIYGSPVPIIAADAESRVTMWNPAAEALFGWSEEEVLGRPNPSIPPVGLIEAAGLQATLLDGQILMGIEIQRQKRDGSIVTVNLSAAPIRDASRRVKGTLEFLTDITEQRRSEAAVRKAEQKYRAIFENAVEGIYQTTPAGGYISANPALARMLGFESPEELITTRDDIRTQEYVNPEMRGEFVKDLQEHGAVWNFEYQAYRKDGRIIWVSENAHVVRGPDGRILYFEGTVEDTTQRHELEQQLQQMQKIEAVGRLAGGVAHDFNNILMAISSYAELLEKKLADDANRRYVSEIVKATDRGSSLTQGLLTFSRKQVVSPKVLDLNTVIAQQIKMLQRLIPENIEMQFDAGKSVGAVRADPSQIEQVVMNVVINSRDAMPDGGRLAISTCNAALDGADCVLLEQTVAGEYVMVCVSDNGCGMSAETQARIFEPFYTTKEQGKGTGLGLAIVFGIVKQNGGQIFVQSKPGLGTTFKIYFPQVADAIRPQDVKTQLTPVRGTETVLLVEDEEGVRESTAEYLVENGYTVLKATGGPNALQIAKQYRGSIDLLLTDLVMPQMSGRELSEKIADTHPQIRVVFMSGYSNNMLSNGQILDPKHTLLQKPFRLGALGQRIREALSSSKGFATGK